MQGPLLNNPKIILADEPTGSLDTSTSKSIMSLMREYNHKSGTTFIIFTHDRNIAGSKERIVELVDGRISKDFSPKEIGEAQAWKELERHACTDCDTLEK